MPLNISRILGEPNRAYDKIIGLIRKTDTPETDSE